MALLEVAGLCAGYGDVPVLRGIDLSISVGSITALIGANGAGKTTLLRAISGIIHAEAGTIRYDGIDIVGMPPHDIVRAGLVQVPEGRRLFPDMTVLENLLVGSSSPVARPKRDESLAMVLDLFPKVRERSAQLAGTLSGGRAADGCDRARADGIAAIAAARRNQPRPRADRRRRNLRRGASPGGAGADHFGGGAEHRAGARSGQTRAMCSSRGSLRFKARPQA
jgi:ABC-type histidine transport system ATPase subunit